MTCSVGHACACSSATAAAPLVGARHQEPRHVSTSGRGSGHDVCGFRDASWLSRARCSGPRGPHVHGNQIRCHVGHGGLLPLSSARSGRNGHRSPRGLLRSEGGRGDGQQQQDTWRVRAHNHHMARAQADHRGGAESRASVRPPADGVSAPQLPEKSSTSGWGSGWQMGSGVAKVVVATVLTTILQAGAPMSGESTTGGGEEWWCQGWWGPQPAEAVLFSPDTKVPRSADVALRRAIPAVNHSVKKMQNELEEISYLLRIPQRKPYGSMAKNVRDVLKLTEEDRNAILESVPANLRAKGEAQYNKLVNPESGLPRLLKAIDDKDPDRISVLLASALDDLAQLKLLQAPGLPFLLPAQYQDLPRLTGRATVEMKIRRAGGEGRGEGGDGSFTLAAGGGPQKTATLEVVLDGYSAPLTAGNFADLVKRKTYDGIPLRVTPNAILSDNVNEKEKAGSLSSQRRSTPLEIMPAGDFQPLYRTTLDVQDGELPVLPLSVYGAVAMAHDPNSETNSSPSQFFFYLYDKRQSGLGGLSFDEGNFAVFGYVTKGREVLPQLQTGDIIESAKLVAGADRLLIPKQASS
ncbi:hypothetical protein CBR_g19822 [Chara braunii]|uniref:PPIase cyclophilin-type domain-containing protein n=1 Tax=Chara braunii TaxID=69332 RepID=A0A388JTZ9_CHABU|nr:hypothetical protein CBR_g19822 [Chara braunii]|eukprot:GBG61289.1 hypothetical protein CBR_g19822 [Chara braunii]